MAKKKRVTRAKKPIKAKPTKYRGTIHKSRLEATWAVFFDFHFMVDAFVYEPKKFNCPETGWSYLPDFYVNFGKLFHYYLEIKPVPPDDQFIKDLQVFVPVLPAPLLIGTGSFFKSKPVIQRLTLDGLGPEEELVDVFMEGADALKDAQQFRFDLPEAKRPRPPFREAVGPTPMDHYNRWASQQKKDVIREREQAREKVFGKTRGKRKRLDQ